MSDGIKRRVFLQGTAMSAGALAGPGRVIGPQPMWVEQATAEYAGTLLGTDARRPILSWVLGSDVPGARQTAYQIRVHGIWDSGKVSSARSVAVAYAGPPLQPRTRYDWQVRVWDELDRPSAWSPASWWETALLGTGWQAQWIGAPSPQPPPGLTGASWIWTATAPPGTRWFRGAFDFPGTRAKIVATADDDFTLYVGGQQILHAPEATDGWKTALTAELPSLSGRVVIAAAATNRGTPGVTNPAGLDRKSVV